MLNCQHDKHSSLPHKGRKLANKFNNDKHDSKIYFCLTCGLHDTQHNDTQHNDTRYKGFNCDTYHKQYNDTMTLSSKNLKAPLRRNDSKQNDSENNYIWPDNSQQNDTQPNDTRHYELKCNFKHSVE